MDILNLDPLLPAASRLHETLANDGYRCTVRVSSEGEATLFALLVQTHCHGGYVQITPDVRRWGDGLPLVGVITTFEVASVFPHDTHRDVTLYIRPTN
jgi:hypothetical protein